MAVIVWTCVMLALSAHLVAPTKVRTCPLPSKVKKATYDKTKNIYTHGQTISYVCNVGFRLKGNKSELQCEDGKWNPPNAECDRKPEIKCEPLSIANGKTSHGRHRLNIRVNITCNDGFYLKGRNVITCESPGIWTPSVPTCVKGMPVTCPPPNVPNASARDRYKAEYEVGESTTISCQEGYDLIGSSKVTCFGDGQWQDLPNCRLAEVKCPRPPFVPTAHTENDERTHYEPDTTLRFRCNLGYRMVRGPSTITCTNGRWSELELKCEKKRCGSAGEVENGRYHYSGSSFGDTVTATCNEGYHLVGAGVRHCMNNGWDGRLAVCEVNQCPEPPEVPDADVDIGTSGIIKPGMVASYSCRLGTLIGQSEIVCGEDGAWSSEAPRCKVETCPPPDIPSGLIFSGVRSRYHSGSSVTIKCNPGWRLLGPHVITCRSGEEWWPRLPVCNKSH